jgi:hypothetical protein
LGGGSLKAGGFGCFQQLGGAGSKGVAADSKDADGGG